MLLVNPILSHFSIQLTELNFSLNGDIFETNVINITILLGGIIYLGNNALKSSLSQREQDILSVIQESEERLSSATSRLYEIEKQLQQKQIIITSIKQDREFIAKQVKDSILVEGEIEILRLMVTAKNQILNIKTKIRKQISNYVVNLALERVLVQLEDKLNYNLQQQIIDKNISKLGD